MKFSQKKCSKIGGDALYMLYKSNLVIFFVNDVKMKVPKKYFLFISSLVVTFLIWIFTLSDYQFIVSDPFLFLSKLVVLIGTVSMCWSFILSARFKFFEIVFHGLDKVYHAHKNISIISFSLICLHPLFQFFRFVPDWERAFGLFVPKALGAVEFGLFAFLLFLLLFALTLWINIPYHIWKKTHELFIFVLILAFFHTVLMDKQVNASFLLSLWIYGFMLLAAFSYAYIRFLYAYIGPKYDYKIKEIEKLRKGWNIYLAPVGKGMAYEPGQFISISFENEAVGREFHLFSISSAPNDELLRLTIKKLGDYTSCLDALKVKDKALVFGPYGRFYEKYLVQRDKDAVLISGGIGVTPFLSMLGHESGSYKSRITYVFYCVKNRQRADFHEEILNYVKMNPNIRYFPVFSDEQGFLNVPQVVEKLGGEVKNKNFFLCGPYPMMRSFSKGLKKEKVKNRNIIFEDFNLLD